MKQTILFLLCAMFTCTCFAQSCVTAKQVSANYETQKVTFELHWDTCNETNHLYRVWVFVDIQPIDVLGYKGAWTPASFTGTPNVINATSETVTNNTRGFYVIGKKDHSATVTMQISNAPAKFNWCAFATDYPPNVGAAANGAIPLRGTPPFTINGSYTEPSKTYTGAEPINILTDATGCPGIVCRGEGEPVDAAGCCLDGLTKVGDVNGYPVYCRNIRGDGASTCTAAGVEIRKMGGYYGSSNPWNLNCAAGWTYMNRTVHAQARSACGSNIIGNAWLEKRQGWGWVNGYGCICQGYTCTACAQNFADVWCFR